MSKVGIEITEEKEDEILERFLVGLEFFFKMDVQQIMQHLKLHKEDGFPSLRHPSGNGSMMCTRKGMRALEELIAIRLANESDNRNFDLSELTREVSERITFSLMETAKRGETANKAFVEAYTAAIAIAKANQKANIFHFPCVLASAKDPETFSLGPVKFTTASAFEIGLLALDPENRKFEENVRDPDFLEYIQKFGWVVSVKVPACSSKVSQQRGELAARTAINIVRVWFGSSYGKRMRLVHTEPATSSYSKFLVEDEEGLYLSWSRTWEAASVTDGWFDQVDRGPGSHHVIVSWLLRDIVLEERSEVVERLIDALSWYGDASFEPSPGAKVAKLAMLLERLTITTVKFSKKRFCRYVAILALDNDEDFEAKYWAAYDFYNARSAISHGSKSQFDDDHWRSLREAESMIVNCIFRALEVYSLIRFRTPTSPKSLRDFFAQQENRWVSKWKALDVELRKRDEALGL